MASPRQAEKREAIDGLMITLLDTFRPKEVPEDGGEPAFRRAAHVPMKIPPELLAADSSLCDMSNWDRLDRHVRQELNLELNPNKLAVSLKVLIHKPNCNPFQIQITNQSSLYIFRRQFELKPIAELHSIIEIVMEAQQKKIFKLVKPKEKRSGKRAATEKKMRDLSTIMYGDSMGRQREGTWTPEADRARCEPGSNALRPGTR